MMSGVRRRLQAQLFNVLRSFVGLGRSEKFLVVLLNDAVLCLVAVLIAFSLRLGRWELWNQPIATFTIVALALWLPIFLWRGIYQSVVRFIGARTMIEIATSCMLMLAALSLIFTVANVPGVPRTVAVMQPLIFAILLMLSRLVGRYTLFDLLNQGNAISPKNRVLIYGAGSAGRQLALSLRHEPHMQLCGYIDDDERLAGKHLDGVRVHTASNLGHLVDTLEIEKVLLAMPKVSRQRREQIVRRFEGVSVRVMTLPAIGNLIDGSVSIKDLRDVEIADLLGRDPVPANEALLHRTIKGRVVLVTGAGGSIGSELCRQIVRLDPARLILVEMTEHALYTIESELLEAQKTEQFSSAVAIHAELGTVIDAETVSRLFDRWQPDTVFHAAAYKHVPLVEENVIAGLRNNVFGTLNCATEARRVCVKNFILVSTDKAVRPTNVMGASKRVCELILQAFAAQPGDTRFAIVRFGNVLGSSGSVVPRFQRQIRDGGPVTLTHREVTRFFMTIPEAAQLVVQAGAMAKGGEVYVLDMGEPIRIYDLATTMINLSGLTVRDASNPDGDIEIREIGLRRGEKLYEELLIGNSPEATDHPRIMQARESMIDWAELAPSLDDLRTALSSGDRKKALQKLCGLVPEFVGEQSIKQ